MSTPNRNLNTPANGDNVDTWNVPVNANWNAIDASFGAKVALNVTGASGTVTLTASQYQSNLLAISGTLTANVNYQFPSGVGGEWLVTNVATGAYTVTLSSAGGGTSVVVPVGAVTNGTLIAVDNVAGNVFVSAPQVTPGGSVGALQYNNGGVFGGDSSLSFSSGTLYAGDLSLTNNPLPVTQGGTGRRNFTDQAVLLGSGTGALGGVAPGTAGNLLTSNGAMWQSAPLALTYVSSFNSRNGAVTLSTADVTSVQATTLGALQTYVFAARHGAADTNSTYAAADLLDVSTLASLSLSGTWRCMGSGGVNSGSPLYYNGLFLRIS